MANSDTYSTFDSGRFADIQDSILSADANPFTYDKYSDKMVFTDDTGVTREICEPVNNLQIFLSELDPYCTITSIPDGEIYMPERTALRLYGSHDFWYILLLLNNCRTMTEYTMSQVKYIRPSELYRLQLFLNLAKNEKKFYNDKYIIHK